MVRLSSKIACRAVFRKNIGRRASSNRPSPMAEFVQNSTLWFVNKIGISHFDSSFNNTFLWFLIPNNCLYTLKLNKIIIVSPFELPKFVQTVYTILANTTL